MRSIRPLLTAAGLAGVLALTAACSQSDDRPSGEPEAAAPPAAGPGSASPSASSLPPVPADRATPAAGKPAPTRSGNTRTGGTDHQKWRAGEWKNWDRGSWRREADEFVNPVIDDLWKPDRMVTAEPPDRTVEPDPAPVVEDGSDPEPAAVGAKPEQTPYRQHAATSGKVFFDAPEGTMVCSATVVKDPANPGRSNLVWTAGHCVHAGSKGGWYRNIAFVPAYNSRGLPTRELASAAPEDIAPYGTFWADWVAASDRWIATGDPSDGTGAPYDYAVLHVKPETGTASLEETVGSALDVDFAAPEAHRVPSLVVRGYPAAAPYDGALMHSCTGRPGRFAFDPAAPAMWRAGCTMTGGSSGGGWVADRAGTPVLVSNTSIGPADPVWLAGPRLGEEAERIYASVSAKYAPQP